MERGEWSMCCGERTASWCDVELNAPEYWIKEIEFEQQYLPIPTYA